MKKEEYSRSIKLNQTQNNEYHVVCEQCIYETKHKVLFSVDDNISNDGIDWYDAYQIIQCQGCQTISFRKGSTSTEDLTYIRLPDGKTTVELVETETLYPLRIITENLYSIHIISQKKFYMSTKKLIQLFAIIYQY